MVWAHTVGKVGLPHERLAPGTVIPGVRALVDIALVKHDFEELRNALFVSFFCCADKISVGDVQLPSRS